MGLGSGPLFPALTVLLAVWVPPNERGTLATVAFSGGPVCVHVQVEVKTIEIFILYFSGWSSFIILLNWSDPFKLAMASSFLFLEHYCLYLVRCICELLTFTNGLWKNLGEYSIMTLTLFTDFTLL